jgi:hypothetical protein
MLHEFLTQNRDLLIERCREKVAKRFEPTEAASTVEHGVPLFLQQLAETLQAELTTSARQSFTAIKTGNIGPGGATGDLLEHTLKELEAITDRLQSPP